MKMENKISAIIPVYNEDRIIGEALGSLKGVVDEIILVHDGKCGDNTLKIAKKFTKRIYTIPHKGRSAFPTAFGLKKAKYNWVLKIDADESLSDEFRKNIRNLIREKNVDSFSFIHPLWDGKKGITKTWPRKTALVRKSKIAYLGFPGFDMSIRTKGRNKKTPYIIRHKPLKNQDVGWKEFREKVLKDYAQNQAKNLLKEFKDFPTFQYDKDDFPMKIKIRTIFPVFTNTLYAFLIFFKQMFYEGAWKEGSAGFQVALKTFTYNIRLGYLIHKEKVKNK